MSASATLLSTGQLVPAAELAELCAQDTELFGRTFFPGAFRDDSPSFHLEINDLLDHPAYRYVAIEAFRGSAKTTKLRTYAAKRISYGISRTILFISETQDHAVRSLTWLRRAVERNHAWTNFYGLAPGDKWTDTVCTIQHRTLEHPITALALGISGQTRGINVEDHRPDLIVVDDPCDDENTATAEQRKKTSETFFGAIHKSLTPPSDEPQAKMVLLQTSLHPEDLIHMCHKDRTWKTARYGCFDEGGNSRWPARFPTDWLLQEKQAHSDRGQIHLWMREMECRIVSTETSAFRGEWVKYWETLPPDMVFFIGIDPVPPPSESQINKGLAGKDFEVLSVVGLSGGDRYLVDLSLSRGHTPEWTISEFFRLVDKWNPLRVRVESIGYQRTLKWLLDEEMKKRRRFVQVNAADDKRKKRHRILQAFSGIGSQGRLYCHRSHVAFIEQFVAYPDTDHDDVLDATSMALDEAMEASDFLGAGDALVEAVSASTMPALPEWRAAP